MNEPSFVEMRELVRSALTGFIHDRPDTPFQEGYWSALVWVWTDVLKEPLVGETLQ